MNDDCLIALMTTIVRFKKTSRLKPTINRLFRTGTFITDPAQPLVPIGVASSPLRSMDPMFCLRISHRIFRLVILMNLSSSPFTSASGMCWSLTFGRAIHFVLPFRLTFASGTSLLKPYCPIQQQQRIL